MKCNLHILLTTILVSATASAFPQEEHAQETGGKVITYSQSFGVGSDIITEDSPLIKFREEVDSLVASDIVGNVSVTGLASVDGGRAANEILASRRAVAMKDWLVSSTGLPANKILLFENCCDWNLLRQFVVESPDIPSRDKVLAVIDSDASELSKIQGLRTLSDGMPWEYLTVNVFPRMRVAIVSLEVMPGRFSAGGEVSPLADSVGEVSLPDDSFEMMTEPVAEPVSESVADITPGDCLGQRMALKSNILYDAALMPSLELEYKFNSRWSVGLEGSVAWWRNNRKHKYYQIATVIPEVRYHLNPRESWGGHYLGLFVGGGKYDLENGKKGYYGEGGMFGVSYNYVFNAGKAISFEAGLGVGAMYTRYKEYIPVNGNYLYQQTKHLWYGGPLRVKFAIVWRFWNTKCKGGDR